ncbi:acyl-CoA/acyl-ACP dehydrogenase [Actinoplanes sp. KI2]|uniref:acyl-CoA dehydrogenase family protein n=1 Tax=Actinoplanes sp. KI2 TaxID=2983315 RepID=UPI0021D5C600|nr:acyl-CoA dehydrogenase family protein [Actinoplanes sp. KI2]MCU7728051.1 acyl-CoA/acyl-ACP dehydrogenase [Actinoplanes sp. KI2]
MRLVPSPEQTAFAAALHDLLAAADVPAAAARWADGDHEPGRRVWSLLAEVGVTGLAVPVRFGGLGAGPADLVVAAEELGHHALPGPVAESLVAVPTLLSFPTAALRGEAEKWLPELAAGKAVATLAAPPWLPCAVDADAADLVLLAEGETAGVGRAGDQAFPSFDRTRRLFEVSPVCALTACPAAGRALDLGALVCAAQLLGAGRALLEAAVTHARTREQFGGPIGRFQAVQQRLAEVAVGLEFARPLLHAAAVTLTARDVSAAKVACAAAAHRAARAALQVHGAIGYAEEQGLARFVTKVRALALSWGTPAQHRARVMAALSEGDAWN